MQENKSIYQWALAVFVFAVLVQGLSWLLLWWEMGTFGDAGMPSQAIRSMFGKDTSLGTVMPKLEFAIRSSILLAIGLLAYGSVQGTPTRREMRRREIANPFENPFA